MFLDAQLICCHLLSETVFLPENEEQELESAWLSVNILKPHLCGWVASLIIQHRDQICDTRVLFSSQFMLRMLWQPVSWTCFHTWPALTTVWTSPCYLSFRLPDLLLHPLLFLHQLLQQFVQMEQLLAFPRGPCLEADKVVRNSSAPRVYSANTNWHNSAIVNTATPISTTETSNSWPTVSWTSFWFWIHQQHRPDGTPGTVLTLPLLGWNQFCRARDEMMALQQLPPVYSPKWKIET